MNSPQKGRIFISYRRVDSEGYAGRIYDRLAPHFGEDAIFMDVDDIPAGVDFVKFLENEVQSCDVLIALIGRQWLNVKDEHGNRRLDNPNDFVRIEITTALERDIRVIPVLLGGVGMPQVAELPENLQPLSRRNGIAIKHDSFHRDMTRLTKELENALVAAEESRMLKAQQIKKELERKENEARKAEEKARLVRDTEEEHDSKAFEEKVREIRIIEAKERASVLRKELWLGRLIAIGDFFSSKIGLFLLGGISLFFFLIYGFSELVPPVMSEPTENPIITVTGTVALTQELPTSTSLPAATSTTVSTPSPTKTSMPTEIPATPTPELSVGSTMVSEKDGMTMVYVPTGEFLMGNDTSGLLGGQPVHKVYLDDYWIDQTEVTNAMYMRCVEAGECKAYSGSIYLYYVDGEWEIYYGNDKYDNYPLVNVGWQKANEYCSWAERRLPTEAEWEKAAGWNENDEKIMIYPWGDTFYDLNANICDKNCYSLFHTDNYSREDTRKEEYDDGYKYTSPVGHFLSGASFYGAYDMSGNVSEWVADWFDSSYYAISPESNPLGPDTGAERVLRGGSYRDPYFISRVSIRDSASENDSRSYVGFRCAMDAE